MVPVTVIAHPINTEAHPTVPAGYRWAVMVGDAAPGDMSKCAEARWCPDEGEALLEGEMVGVAVVKALRMCGIETGMRTTTMDHDPIPAGHDRITIGG